jgi:hypothetical protein
MFISCDVHDDRLNVINLSAEKIALSTELDTIPEYPSVDKTEYYFRTTLRPQDSTKLLFEGRRMGWSFFISESVNNKLNLFVYNIDSLKKYQSIDTLIKNRLYTRYSFAEKDLDRSNWEIVIEK